MIIAADLKPGDLFMRSGVPVRATSPARSAPWAAGDPDRARRVTVEVSDGYSTVRARLRRSQQIELMPPGETPAELERRTSP